MSERLPSNVLCSSCRKVVPIARTRRFVSCWARPKKGGTLSGVRDLHTEDLYRCDECVNAGRFYDKAAQAGML